MMDTTSPPLINDGAHQDRLLADAMMYLCLFSLSLRGYGTHLMMTLFPPVYMEARRGVRKGPCAPMPAGPKLMRPILFSLFLNGMTLSLQLLIFPLAG